MFLLDVSLNQLSDFRKGDPVIFWYETASDFVLLKPYNSAWLRCVIGKRADVAEADNLFRGTFLSGTGSVHVNSVQGIDDSLLLQEIVGFIREKRYKEAIDLIPSAVVE